MLKIIDFLRRFSSLYAGTITLKCRLDFLSNDGNSIRFPEIGSKKYFSFLVLIITGYGLDIAVRRMHA